MTDAPAPRTWVDGEKPPVDTLNQEFYSTWSFLLNPPMVKARQTSLQAQASGGWVVMNFQAEDVDTHGMHSSTSPSRFYPKVPGYYVGYAGGSWAAASSLGRRIVVVRKNGVLMRNARADSLAPSNGASAVFVIKGVAFGPVYMNGTTDYFDVATWQDSSISINTYVGSGTTDYEEQPEFYARWVSK